MSGSSVINCPTLDCFNCAYTQDTCSYDTGIASCVNAADNPSHVSNQIWFEYFRPCADRYHLCASNLIDLARQSGSVTDSLADGNTAFFTISPDYNPESTQNTIQRNYYCKWSISLDQTQKYKLEITRQEPI